MTLYLNGKQDAEYINPAILDWYTLAIQDTGINDYLTVATTIPQWHDTAAISDSANIRYILTRRPIPIKSTGVTANDAVSGTTASETETNVITSFTAALDETLYAQLNLNGKCKGIINIGVVTSNVSGTAYLNDITVSLYKANTTGRTLIGSDTIALDVSNATISEVIYNVPFMINTVGNTISNNDVLYIVVTTTGYNSSASYTTTHKIYFTRGTFASFAELQV